MYWLLHKNQMSLRSETRGLNTAIKVFITLKRHFSGAVSLTEETASLFLL